MEVELKTHRQAQSHGVFAPRVWQYTAQRNHVGRRRTISKSSYRADQARWHLVAILSLGADEHQFDYPLRRYKALREKRADSNPLSTEELKRFFHTLDIYWYDYLLVRFYTGLRSCELHGLHERHIDFEHRLIRVRQNYVNGELGELKTTRSQDEQSRV